MAGATARERGREGVQADQSLTLGSPAVSVRPEEDGRRRIWRRRLAGPARESATPATIPGAGLQFLELGGRGRLWGPSQLVGGARGGTGRRL
jgi:hypothetical protein